MIIDILGIPLIPGNLGKDCPGNGKHGNIECCCDACDYFLCCVSGDYHKNCMDCSDQDCPRHSMTII